MANHEYETYGTPVRPRDYGVVLRTPRRERLFVSPTRLALAELMADTPQEAHERIRERARASHVPVRDLEISLRKGLRSRSDSEHLLDESGRDLLEASRLGKSIVANVTNGGGRVYRVSLTFSGDSYARVSCACADSQWSDVKGVEYEMCKHSAFVHAALSRDASSGISAEGNITGLLPRERLTALLPLVVSHDQVIDVLIAYSGKESLYGIGRDLLSAEPSGGLDDALRNGSASFAVLRQSRAQGSDSRVAGASRALESRLRGRFADAGFHFDGYGLEFKGTEYESVGIRFGKGDQRLALCFWNDLPPVVVDKNLKDHVRSTGVDVRDDSPFKRLGWYDAVDDSTRRHAVTRVIVPGFREDGRQIQVSRELMSAYRKLI